MREDDEMDTDEILTAIGGFGPVQKRICYTQSVVQIFMALHFFIPSFIGLDPGWMCSVSSNNSSSKVVVADEKKCLQYERGDCIVEYSQEFTSIVTEWDLICSRSFLPHLSQSVLFLSALIGSWPFGIMSDMMGRRKVIFIAMIGACLSGLGYSLSSDFHVFVFFRATIALCLAGLLQTVYILCMEVVGPAERSSAGMIAHGSFAVGLPVLAGMAYFIHEWRVLSIAATLSGLSFLLLWRILPESPRWLLVNGREEEAWCVLNRIAEGNGTILPNCEIKRPVVHPSERNVSTINLLRGKNIRHRTLVLICLWFMNSLLYNGLTMDAGELGGNRYTSFSLSGIIEIPSCVAAFVLVDRVGRKWTHATFLFSSGWCCLLWALLHWMGDGGGFGMVLAILGKFAVSGSYTILYLYTTELYPTQVRNLGLGMVGTGGWAGGIIAPMVLLLAQYGDCVPMVLMGTLGLVVSIIGLSLPETFNQHLPETLVEVEQHALRRHVTLNVM